MIKLVIENGKDRCELEFDNEKIFKEAVSQLNNFLAENDLSKFFQVLANIIKERN